jgi:hypothetical protein
MNQNVAGSSPAERASENPAKAGFFLIQSSRFSRHSPLLTGTQPKRSRWSLSATCLLAYSRRVKLFLTSLTLRTFDGLLLFTVRPDTPDVVALCSAK